MVHGRFLLGLALGAILAVSSACGGAVTPVAGQSRFRGPLPYAGHEAQLFDDAIEPRAVGYELDGTSVPMSDSMLRERTQVGDRVVRARVTTVTSKQEDRGLSWQIGFHTIQSLVGSGPFSDDFTVDLGPNNPSAGIMRAWDGRLIGLVFVVFAREFARPGSPGEVDLHVHLARDSKEEAWAVHAAVAIAAPPTVR